MAILGINIDHIATLRQLRNTAYPSLMEALKIVEAAGADQITAHLREDRRHIVDQDVIDLKKNITTRFNLEMAATDEMLNIALELQPEIVCIVPEKREEKTTEGGLNIDSNREYLTSMIPKLQNSHIEVSLFIEPNTKDIQSALDVGATTIELHTGRYCNVQGDEQKRELESIHTGIDFAKSRNMTVNVGHGLDTKNIIPLLDFKDINEFNIGHSIICRSVFVGLETAVKEMVELIRGS